MLTCERAIALVYVPWSPGPRFGMPLLAALEATSQDWSRNNRIGFFVLYEEAEARLSAWFAGTCKQYEPRFVLHGNGWGPFWWLVHGGIVDCIEKPYEASIEELKERSKRLFGIDAD